MFAAVAAVMAMIIIGGTLYPFAFSRPPDDLGAVRALLGTLTDPIGRGNFLANIILYLPLGFFLVQAGRPETGSAAGVSLAIVTGTLLSVSLELMQYYVAGRESTAIDIYANALGAALGAIGGRLLRSHFRRPSLRGVSASPVPILLLTAWLAYRLYPYVPTIDLHKYWDALKPVVLFPSLTAYDLFRYSAIWLAVALLLAATVGYRRLLILFPLFVGAVLFARILIISTTLSVAEIAGAGVAFAILLIPAGMRVRVAVAALLLGVYVLTLRLQPFHFHAYPGEFGWIPFRSFLHGAMSVNAMSFLEKFFLYGSLIWLLSQAGLRLPLAAALVATALFTTSLLQIYLPGRSAETTDAVLAILIAVIIGSFRAEAKNRPSPPHPQPAASASASRIPAPHR
ncbi:MAG: hypothetical protein BroJett029_41870 [Alphaproteobacteria bacterium]|nr:MAG: hypothetical protein BroJett029_41870 [Alphaproteobacteria bacterium]